VKNSSWKLIEEPEFKAAITSALKSLIGQKFDFVTGPGRSGAIASVYASHILGVPFAPHKSNCLRSSRILVVDTAEYTGETMRRALSYYRRADNICESVVVFRESKRNLVYFWYEL
jgi:adenine/guanine phosphoribosyltransferase-like PRPP-binding protein